MSLEVGGGTEKGKEEKEKIPLCESRGHRPLGGRCSKQKLKNKKSSKDRTWSAVPVALLGQFCLGCGEGAGQRPQRADVL